MHGFSYVRDGATDVSGVEIPFCFMCFTFMNNDSYVLDGVAEVSDAEVPFRFMPLAILACAMPRHECDPQFVCTCM